MAYEDIIAKHANRVGLDPLWLRKIMRIESGGDPRNVTGSYQGLFQLSRREFTRHGGSGDILDPEQNTMAAANKLAQEKLEFKQKHGRDPTLKDLYMVHQQGPAGYAAHMANPDKPAWQNMLSTGEGRQKGEKWAKAAIWGNLSAAQKAKYGSVENVTSAAFTSEWGSKIEGTAPSEVMARARARREGAPSEVELRATEPTRKTGLDTTFHPVEVPEFTVPRMVPDIRLARPPR